MSNKKYKIGYTQGVFDMFHIGHLNLLRNAKEQCDFLIVGINSDRLVMEYKNKDTVVKEQERLEIVQSVKFVDCCKITHTLDKVEQWKKYHFDAIFIGTDWKGDTRWENTEKQLEKYKSEVVFLDYTKGICSTNLRGKKGVKE